MKQAFKSLPKNARDYNLTNLPIGSVIYSPSSRNSYEIKEIGNNGYLCINQQTELTSFLSLHVFNSNCYTAKL